MEEYSQAIDTGLVLTVTGDGTDYGNIERKRRRKALESKLVMSVPLVLFSTKNFDISTVKDNESFEIIWLTW